MLHQSLNVVHPKRVESVIGLHLQVNSRHCPRVLVTILFWILFAQAAWGLDVIGFEGVAPPGGTIIPGTPYVESGYVFTSNQPNNGIFSATVPGVNSNGTDIFGWCASDCGGTQVITITGPGPFNLFSIDVSNLALAAVEPGMSVDLMGFYSNGGSIFRSLPVTENWTTHAVAGFVNLTHLEITAVDPNIADLRDSAIDNLRVSLVPEPSCAFLVLAAMIVSLHRSGRPQGGIHHKLVAD